MIKEAAQEENSEEDNERGDEEDGTWNTVSSLGPEIVSMFQKRGALFFRKGEDDGWGEQDDEINDFWTDQGNIVGNGPRDQHKRKENPDANPPPQDGLFCLCDHATQFPSKEPKIHS